MTRGPSEGGMDHHPPVHEWREEGVVALPGREGQPTPPCCGEHGGVAVLQVPVRGEVALGATLHGARVHLAEAVEDLPDAGQVGQHPVVCQSFHHAASISCSSWRTRLMPAPVMLRPPVPMTM